MKFCGFQPKIHNLKDEFPNKNVLYHRKAAQKSTPLITREKVWNFWHENSQESANTSQVVKIPVDGKLCMQDCLDFVSTVTVVKQRNRDYYQSIWKTVTVPFKSLYFKYCKENLDFVVSYGTFFSIKPFYVCSASSKDLKMCCCKLHLHARWAIAALLECAKKKILSCHQKITKVFFSYLTADCAEGEHTFHGSAPLIRKPFANRLS